MGVWITKTHFHIENKEFADYIKLSTQEKEYYFCDDLTIEYADCDRLAVDIEWMKAEDYQKIKVRNPLLRLLLSLVKCFFAVLLYFIDNEDGIGLDKGYSSFNPFTVKQSITINSPDEKTIHIRCLAPVYNKMTKKYGPPTVKLMQEDVGMHTETVRFSAASLKQEWITYHVPAFSVIMILLLLLNWLGLAMLVRVISEKALYPTLWAFGGIIGASFCSLVMIALLVTYIIVIARAYRLYKTVVTVNEG